MKNLLQTCFAGILFGAVATANAGVTAFQGLGTNSWVGTPSIMSSNPPNLFSFPTAENNYINSTQTNLAQSFKVLTGGTLDNLQLLVSGNAMTNTIKLFDLGTTSPASFTPGSGATSANLFSAGLTFVFLGSATPSVLELKLSGVDAISLNSGDVYAFEIDPTASGQMTWYRDGDAYANGSAYRGEALLNGVQRDLSIAVTIVPEPSALALLGGSLASLGWFRRFRK